VSSQVSLTFLHPLANLVQVPNPANDHARGPPCGILGR
jgi:hypothetical protein